MTKRRDAGSAVCAVYSGCIHEGSRRKGSHFHRGVRLGSVLRFNRGLPQFQRRINSVDLSCTPCGPQKCVCFLSPQKVHDMLKKGWDAEGSPFRGQQFDPTMFDIPPSAVQF